jgi:hypothetical protein
MQLRMSQPKAAFALLVVFFAGCAAERLLVVPPALAVPPPVAGTNPQRWQYDCRHAQDAGELDSMAAQMGKEGWELAATGMVSGWTMWCFKRPLP